MFSLEFLNECFALDEERGILTWKERPAHHFGNEHTALSWNGKFSGRIAGCHHTDGRLRVNIGGTKLFVHRVIYAMVNQISLEDFGIIDHANGDFLNNQPANLREADASQNCMNTIPARTLESGAKKGVRQIGNRWRARIQAYGKRKNLGTFGSEDEAFNAYVSAARTLHAEFMRV